MDPVGKFRGMSGNHDYLIDLPRSRGLSALRQAERITPSSLSWPPLVSPFSRVVKVYRLGG